MVKLRIYLESENTQGYGFIKGEWAKEGKQELHSLRWRAQARVYTWESQEAQERGREMDGYRWNYIGASGVWPPAQAPNLTSQGPEPSSAACPGATAGSWIRDGAAESSFSDIPF